MADEARSFSPNLEAQPALTVRSLIAGSLLAVVCGAAGPYLHLYLQGSNPGDAYYTSPVSHFLFFLIVGLLNVALRLVRRSWAFGRGELVAIYIMMTLANGTHPMVQYWASGLPGPVYLATVENDWANLVQPYIPDWVAPTNPTGVAAFYEGNHGELSGTNWSVWLDPILSWLPLILAVNLGTLCLMVILRRQWSERERLVFPLVQVSLAMIQRDDERSWVNPFFRSRMMWLGFSVPGVIGLLQGLNSYFPAVPTITYHTQLEILPGLVSVPIVLSTATLGFLFLTKREVAFSLWVFYLFNVAQRALYGVLGFGWEEEPAVSIWSYNVPSLVHQSMGAMIVLVLGGLWVGREHLARVFRAARAGSDSAELGQADEIISFRGALVGLCGSGVAIVAWMWASGVPLAGVMVFLFFALVVCVGITRLVAEGGVAVVYAPLVAADASVSALGSAFFGPTGLTGVTLARVWCNDLLNFSMPHCANGLRLSEQIGARRRWLFGAMLAAIMLGAASGVWALMELSHRYGVLNMRPAYFLGLPEVAWSYVARLVVSPTGPDSWGWFHTGLGAIAMGLLMTAQRVFFWWPLHPLGFPFSSVFGWISFNAFLAWLIKGLVLKYGGARLYLLVRPFFLGLILGQFAMYGLFWIVDSFTGMIGNKLIN